MRFPDLLLPKRDTRDGLKKDLAWSLAGMVVCFLSIILCSFVGFPGTAATSLLLMLAMYTMFWVDETNRARSHGWYR